MGLGMNRIAERPKAMLIPQVHHAQHGRAPTKCSVSSIFALGCNETRLISLKHLCLLKTLHGIDFRCVSLLHETNLGTY